MALTWTKYLKAVKEDLLDLQMADNFWEDHIDVADPDNIRNEL